MENFVHLQAAHCENGVTTNLLKNAGLDFMTEPLAFGMGSGLFFIYIPFLNFSNGPAISFRTMPGRIFKRTCRSLDISVKSYRFRSETEGRAELDRLLLANKLVGCQVGVFHLSYFPIEYRFHFNAHNLIVYGKDDGNYLISDPIMDKVTSLTTSELDKVRFAKGLLAPKGHIYYIDKTKPVSTDTIRRGIEHGIRRNVRDMLYIPGNIGGVNGIKFTAGRIRKWRDKLGVRKAGQFLAQIIRMQEEIGTGGGGFRFIYAAFLQEAAGYFQNEKMLPISDKFTLSGDLWRQNAVNMAGVFRGRNTGQADFDRISDVMLDIYKIEKEAFNDLKKLKLM